MTNMLLSYPTGLVACVSQLKSTSNKLVKFNVCFCFKHFPAASRDFFLLQVSDSFDVFKACKDCNNQSYTFCHTFFPQISEISGEIRG